MRPSLGLALDLEKVDGPASREIWCVRRGAQTDNFTWKIRESVPGNRVAFVTPKLQQKHAPQRRLPMFGLPAMTESK
jgi:hypothetical protein